MRAAPIAALHPMTAPPGVLPHLLHTEVLRMTEAALQAATTGTARYPALPVSAVAAAVLYPALPAASEAAAQYPVHPAASAVAAVYPAHPAAVAAAESTEGKYVFYGS